MRIVRRALRVRISEKEIQRVWWREESRDLAQQAEENTMLFTILVQAPSAFW